ncbi:hypothetical protein ACIQGZ_17385 [Streptomyces sp. NPDC092296]|uniref:hypothetical protein n=1 Tax=Streptomyces sp. NPDC092296 TaxID=3366012 RepID=UPI0038234D0C
MSATPPHFEDDTNRMMNALAHGVTGNRPAALAELRPIIARGPVSTYAMLAALAETATGGHKAAPGTFLGPAIVQNGRLGSVGPLPEHLRFAARFLAAHANGDTGTRDALYWALLADDTDRGCTRLAEAIGTVFDMAVATVAQRRRSPSI